jgi:TfoX/Sxy family transcriptional regulator of competence genes
MAYDEELADRIRAAVAGDPRVHEKRMFGGIAFMRGDRMFVGIVKDELMVRVGPAAYEAALARPHVRPMDFTGKPMVGYVFVGAEGCRTVAAVSRWVEAGARFVEALGESTAKRRPARRAPADRDRAKRTPPRR